MYFATKNGMPRTEDLKELKELSAVPVSVFAVSDYLIQAQLSEFQRASTVTGLQLGVTAMICDEHAARRPGLPAALLGSASAAALGRPDRRRPVVQPMGPADNGAMLIVTAWTGAHLLHPQ